MLIFTVIYDYFLLSYVVHEFVRVKALHTFAVL